MSRIGLRHTEGRDPDARVRLESENEPFHERGRRRSLYLAVMGTRKIWTRAGLGAFAALALYQLFSGPGGLFNLIRLHSAKQERAYALDSLETVKLSLEREKRLLRSDTAYIGKTAREKLGMAMPGEKVYRYMGTRPQGQTKDSEGR